MSDRKTEDDLPSVDTTNPILKPVDTNPAIDAVDTDPKLKPLSTITLDEDPPPAPSSTLLLDPVQEAATNLKLRAAQDLGVSSAVTVPKKRKAPLKADAFESAPSLVPAKREDLPRGSPSPWKKAEVWTPGLMLLTAALIFMVLVTIVVLLRS